MTNQNLGYTVNIIRITDEVDEVDEVEEITEEESKEYWAEVERNSWEEFKKYLLRNNCPIDKLSDDIQKKLKL